MSPAHQRMTAADIINHYQEKRLANIFFAYGEEPRSRAIARAIVGTRTSKKILTTKQLVDLILTIIPVQHKRGRTIHPATKIFQALRIEVNHELENIKSFLAAGLKLLNSGGRLVCISFHSLEDRLVKNYFKEHTDKLTILTSKPIQARDEEVALNPSSRSAKLRAAERI